MKCLLSFILFFAVLPSIYGQKQDTPAVKHTDATVLIDDTRPATWQNVDTVKAPVSLDNIYSRAMYSDSLVSSFVLFVKSEVKEHKHVHHAEHILVLDGEAEMRVDSKSFRIKKGDLIYVPKNTYHYVKVTSKTPLKVLSIQAPHFDGKDRVFKETK